MKDESAYIFCKMGLDNANEWFVFIPKQSQNGCDCSIWCILMWIVHYTGGSLTLCVHQNEASVVFTHLQAIECDLIKR